MSGFVYFIQPENRPWVKVGYAADVDSRMIALQCGSPEQLRLLTYFPGTRADEFNVRTLVAVGARRGEWVRVSDWLLAVVATLQQREPETRAALARVLVLAAQAGRGMHLASQRAREEGTDAVDEFHALPPVYSAKVDMIIAELAPWSSAGRQA